MGCGEHWRETVRESQAWRLKKRWWATAPCVCRYQELAAAGVPYEVVPAVLD